VSIAAAAAKRRPSPLRHEHVATAAAPDRAGALDAGLRELGVALSDAQRAKLGAFIALLAKWNRTYNLTAIREPERMVTHHLLDALAVLPHLPQRPGLRVLDAGAGGGVPGIPLAVARPDWTFVLVDASRKKATFLAQAAIELALPNVSARDCRVEALATEAPFDAIVARAFADLRTFVQSTRRLLAPGGRFYAMKGAMPDDEIAALPADIEVVAAPALAVPGLSAQRHLIVLRPRGADR
jgi:16S rRNA (guanine527-N7)-methyltransferase